VLTPIGLLPAAAVGADIDALLAGAAAVDDDYQQGGELVTRWADALLRALSLGLRTVPIVVYGRRLERVANWAQQLLMESLGKRLDRDGAEVHQGLTVVAARGPADQHSMLQEWMEGPRDKFACFIVLRPATQGPPLPASLSDDSALQGLRDRTPGEVQLSLYRGTADALAASGVPSTTLVVDRLGPRSIGGLLFTLELSCALVAEGLNVNAFDQPAVEDGKRRAREVLAAFADKESELDDELNYLLGEG
jgi:glucose-6-phosphate isomerase